MPTMDGNGDHSGLVPSTGNSNSSSNSFEQLNALVVQEFQKALFSPNAATPMFDSITSPSMGGGLVNLGELTDTPLFADMDDFAGHGDDDSLMHGSLFPAVAATIGNGMTSPLMGQSTAAMMAAVAASTGTSTVHPLTSPVMMMQGMFPDLPPVTTTANNTATPIANAINIGSNNVDNNGLLNKSISMSWEETADALSQPNTTYNGTHVRTLPDGGFVITTKRGSTTLSAQQAASLIAGQQSPQPQPPANKRPRRRQTPSTAGLPRPGPLPSTTAPLGAGGVRLVGSAAPSPANAMLDSFASPQLSMAAQFGEDAAAAGGDGGAESDNDMDPLAVKRLRNTDAARRSRLRKVLKMEALERRVSELMNENADMRTRLAVLENEKTGWQSKETEMRDQLRTLEHRLDEAHRSMREQMARPR